jgi:hypothetical protein
LALQRKVRELEEQLAVKDKVNMFCIHGLHVTDIPF